MNDRVGQQLGNYRLLRLLGQGGQASVYLGEHIYLKSQAALKVRHTVLTGEERAIFLQEAQTLVRLSHPHIVRVLDFALQDGVPFLVMECAAHGTLRQRHPKGTKLPLDVIIPYVQQMASALQYTHDQRLIHRDVKPENMLLNSRDEVLLSDFGLVMHTPQQLSSEATEPMEQSMAGTTPYLAPEQLRGKAQPASDQYALGVVVYEWLCGKPPFQGPFLEVAVQQVSAPPPSLREQMPDLSPAIEEVVLRALAKDPEQRFARVQDFATALERASQEAVSQGYTRSGSHPDIVVAGLAPAMFPPALGDLPQGTVTLLFTDMEGSTHLLQQLGDRYASVLAECRQLLRVAFQHWSGHEVDTQGDAFFVAFARATDAVSAAVEAQRALASHAWPEGAQVRVRMGLHTGEPSLTAEGYVGLDVHRAARIMSAGHGGQILLSQSTRELVEHDLPDDVSLRDLGEHRLKDLERPQRLFQLVIADLPADFPPLKTLDAHPNNLPIQPTPFIGREQELTVVADLLLREDVRLLTLTGPGGTGKTRLGLQVAAELSDRLTDGVFFVDLAPLSDPTFVMPTIAETVDIREVPGQPLLERLKEHLQQKQMLLLLDNFEQVVSAASHVAALLAACPKLKIVVTSREVLHVRAEHEFAVPPLELPDLKRLPDPVALSRYAAVALFLQRAQAVKPAFQLTNTNAQAVAEICVRLDGLPLAIELAAARIKLFSPQALLARLGQRLAVLTSGARDVPARQQTLRNTITWSYDLLSAPEQRLFRQLALFAGGCQLAAAEAICSALQGGDGAGSILDGIASLLDKSLLQQTEQETEEPRLLMVETIREYGLEALAANGEMEGGRRAHASYYLALAEEAEPQFWGPQQGTWFERLEREHDNLRAAMQWWLEQGQTEDSVELALRFGGAVARFWEVHGHWSEGRNFLECALARSEGVEAPVRLKALLLLGLLVYFQGDHDRAEALVEEALALSRELGDTRGIATSLRRQGFVVTAKGNPVRGRALIEEALMLSREVGDKVGISAALINLGLEAMNQGEYAKARALLEEFMVIVKELGDERSICHGFYSLAQVSFVSRGDPAEVRSLLEEGLAVARELGYKEIIVGSIYLSGQLALQQGDVATARALGEESVAHFREMGNQWSIVEANLLLAQVAAHQGDHPEAYALYEECLAIARKCNYQWAIAFCLEGLASMVAAQEPGGASTRDALWAARLWGAAEALREAIGTPLPPIERAAYERAITAVRTHLGEHAFATAWAQGRAMTPEQALAAKGPVTTPAPVPTTQPSPSLEDA